MQKLKIKNIKKLNKTNDRYDLTINTTKNFFANGILIHNTSAVLAHVLCKKKLRFRDKLAMKLGIKVEESYYDYLFSSRRCVKNNF